MARRKREREKHFEGEKEVIAAAGKSFAAYSECLLPLTRGTDAGGFDLLALKSTFRDAAALALAAYRNWQTRHTRFMDRDLLSALWDAVGKLFAVMTAGRHEQMLFLVPDLVDLGALRPLVDAARELYCS